MDRDESHDYLYSLINKEIFPEDADVVVIKSAEADGR